MGDGVITKRAIVVNTDDESRHLDNVTRALERLNDHGYESYVLNPVKVHGATVYDSPSRGNIFRMIDRVARLSDDDDELLIYVTGHGGGETGDAFIPLEDGSALPVQDFANRLNRIEYGQRSVIADSCYSGKWRRHFANNQSLFVSAAGENETAVCILMAPYFWKECSEIIQAGGDTDHNQLVSFRERYDYAISVYLKALPQKTPNFVQGWQFSDQGFHYGEVAMSRGQSIQPPSISSAVTSVFGKAQLRGALGAMRTGQVALVLFRWGQGDGSTAEHALMQNIAMQRGNPYHLIEVFNADTELATEYYVFSYPTMYLVKSRSNDYLVVRVRDRQNPLRHLPELNQE